MADIMQFVQNPPLSPYQFVCGIIALVLVIAAGNELVHRNWRWGIIVLLLAVFAFMAGFAPRTHASTTVSTEPQVWRMKWDSDRSIERWCNARHKERKEYRVCILECRAKQHCH